MSTQVAEPTEIALSQEELQRQMLAALQQKGLITKMEAEKLLTDNIMGMIDGDIAMWTLVGAGSMSLIFKGLMIKQWEMGPYTHSLYLTIGGDFILGVKYTGSIPTPNEITRPSWKEAQREVLKIPKKTTFFEFLMEAATNPHRERRVSATDY